MVIKPRDAPFTRDEVYTLVQGWKKAKNLQKMPPLRDYLRGKLEPRLGAETQVMRQTEDQGLQPQGIIDTVLEDLDSYIPRDQQDA